MEQKPTIKGQILTHMHTHQGKSTRNKYPHQYSPPAIIPKKFRVVLWGLQQKY